MFCFKKKNKDIILTKEQQEKILLIFNSVEDGYKAFLKSGFNSINSYLKNLIGEWWTWQKKNY